MFEIGKKAFNNSKGFFRLFLKENLAESVHGALTYNREKIELYDICDVAQSSGADISGIMSDSLRVALVKLRVCSNSDSSNSLLPRSHLSLNLPRFYPLSYHSLSLSLSFSLSRV